MRKKRRLLQDHACTQVTASHNLTTLTSMNSTECFVRRISLVIAACSRRPRLLSLAIPGYLLTLAVPTHKHDQACQVRKGWLPSQVVWMQLPGQKS